MGRSCPRNWLGGGAAWTSRRDSKRMYAAYRGRGCDRRRGGGVWFRYQVINGSGYLGPLRDRTTEVEVSVRTGRIFALFPEVTFVRPVAVKSLVGVEAMLESFTLKLIGRVR